MMGRLFRPGGYGVAAPLSGRKPRGGCRISNATSLTRWGAREAQSCCRLVLLNYFGEGGQARCGKLRYLP
ncbi:hypothetical protein ACVXG7_04290 [Enterobacter hormaechei]